MTTNSEGILKYQLGKAGVNKSTKAWKSLAAVTQVTGQVNEINMKDVSSEKIKAIKKLKLGNAPALKHKINEDVTTTTSSINQDQKKATHKRDGEPGY